MKQKFLLLTAIIFVVVLGYATLSPTVLINLFDSKQSVSQILSETENKIPTQTGKNLFLKQSSNLTIKVDPELVDLDSQIISCSPDISNLSTSHPTVGGSCVGGTTTLSTTSGLYLGGQCCGSMTNLGEYHDNLKKLQSYRNIPDIPLNPHKTPIPLAQKWITYDNQTTLASDEQQVMNQAMAMSKEGPCCCKCWHYFVNEGVAKKLIKDYAYTAKQIDDYWEASDIC